MPVSLSLVWIQDSEPELRRTSYLDFEQIRRLRRHCRHQEGHKAIGNWTTGRSRAAFRIYPCRNSALNFPWLETMYIAERCKWGVQVN